LADHLSGNEQTSQDKDAEKEQETALLTRRKLGSGTPGQRFIIRIE
jgi:hypothetical protein